ncbi:hypothetical protein C9926_00395 [Sulfurovum lithotrophicum]|nr:hypothetical protein C9926_00395 [Sulfurovum lithotrophicum]
MKIETMIIVLLLMFIGYVVMSYKKLITQHKNLEDMQKELTIEMTDKLRREYNAIARDYNNTLSGFIGKRLAHKLKYEKKAIIEKI